jgi:hypothetical protein
MRALRAIAASILLASASCQLQEPVPNGGGNNVDGLGPPPTAGQGMFPNSPDDPNWVTAQDAEWTLPPVAASTYAPDNGSHLVTFGTASDVSLIDAPDAPWASGAKAISIRLPAGLPGGTLNAFVGQHRSAAGQVGPLAFPANLTDGALYVGFWVKNRGSNGQPYTPLGQYTQVNRGNVAQKWIYLTSSGVPDNQSIAHQVIGWSNAEIESFLTDDPAETRRVYPTWGPQFHPTPGSKGCFANRYQPPSQPNTNGWRDEIWHRVEYLLLPNTFESDGTPREDGRVIIWLDGRQTLDATNVVNYCSAQRGSDGSVQWTMSNVILEPIYGGGVNPVPYDLYIDFGRIKIAYRKRQ